MNIPDQVSFEQLQKLADSADTQATEQLEPTQENIIAVAKKHVDSAYEELNDPMVHKLMMMYITNMFYHYHLSSSKDCLEKGEIDNAAAWMRDAGQLQVIAKILQGMQLSENDFTCER